MRHISRINIRPFCIAAVLGVTSAAFGQVQEEWVARFDGADNSFDYAAAIALDSVGNVYVTGDSRGSSTGIDYATIKYDSNGNLLWERRYNGPGNDRDRATALDVDSAGNVYVTGDSWGTDTQIDFATLKYDTDGNLLWERRYSGPDNAYDSASAIAVDGTGNVYVTGTSAIVSDLDYMTLKYDTDGNLLWERRYSGPGNGFDGAVAVAIDDAGNVYVTGESNGSGSRADYVTIKYDTNGNILWEKRYNGPSNSFDEATALVVDSAGNVYVTGDSFGGIDTGEDYATIKYDTNGNLLWERRYNGPASGYDSAAALAVDSGGNVYITGSSSGSGTAKDYTTLKYDSNGSLLWVRRYSGPNNGNNVATALALDTAGNVYITGGSPNLAGDYEYATLKYNPNGNLLWEIRFHGPENISDVAVALALDRAGNVYVTGHSYSSGTFQDYATIKYSQSVEVLPDSYELFRGFLTGGGLAELLASDDSYLTVQPGITLNQAERQVQLVIVGTSPTETPTELQIRVEAHAEINNIGQWIELWNYDTSSWEEVDFMIATMADSIVEVSITTNPERFIEAGTKQMKAKVSYKEAGIVLSFPWLISFDETVWVIVP
ncbi:MAG: SBBP repeat-containing protein [Armatimonadetes bacterium]|nr:SBBP repeat-containing protein [Armatimonadota bacterium]